MEIVKILYGHTTSDNAYIVEDYSYSRKLRTTKTWVDTHPKKGDRIATVTVSPTTYQHNRIRYSTYNTLMFLFLDKDGYVQQAGYNFRTAVDLKAVFRKLVGQLDLFQLSEMQLENIRRHFLLIMVKEANYVHNLLPHIERNLYQQWFKEVVVHIQTRPINEIHLFPDDPSGPAI